MIFFLEQARQLCLIPDGVEPYLQVIDADMKWLGQLTEAETYDGAREILQQVTWEAAASGIIFQLMQKSKSR